MNVIIIPPYYLPLSIGGFQSQVYHIFDELKELGVNVGWYNFQGCDWDNIDILQVMSIDASMLPVMKRARDRGVNVVLTPMQGSRAKSNIYLKTALFLSKIPQLFSYHKAAYSTIHAADFLTPLCSFEANKLVDVYGFDNERLKVIPNGIDQVFFEKNAANVEIPFNEYVLIVGRIEENKNQLTLIKAVKKLGMNLIIVGEPGDDGPTYMKKCKAISNDKIFFWGVESNKHILKTLYRKAIVTVIPSYSEMVPLVAFESLSQNTPVVCTNRCGIADDNIPGLFFTKPDEKSLVLSLTKVCQFDRNLINKKGIYTWADIAKMYIQVYKNLIENH